MPESDERQQQILDAAATVIIRSGYDKTTMSDIADEAGISRGTVYLNFSNKEDLFEALLYREWMQYAQTWLAYVEADPQGGTIGGIYRAIFRAINSRPFIAFIIRRDRRVIGSYLRKSDNLFVWMRLGGSTVEFMRRLQEVGTIRQDVDLVVNAHLLDMLSYGYLTIEDFKPSDEFPSDKVVLEALVDMMNRLLPPENGGNLEAGKGVIRQIVSAAQAQMQLLHR